MKSYTKIIIAITIVLFISLFYRYNERFIDQSDLIRQIDTNRDETQLLVDDDEIADARRAATQSYDLELGMLTDNSILREIDAAYQI